MAYTFLLSNTHLSIINSDMSYTVQRVESPSGEQFSYDVGALKVNQ